MALLSLPFVHGKVLHTVAGPGERSGNQRWHALKLLVSDSIDSSILSSYITIPTQQHRHRHPSSGVLTCFPVAICARRPPLRPANVKARLIKEIDARVKDKEKQAADEKKAEEAKKVSRSSMRSNGVGRRRGI
ncbi:hypothetical protein CCMA1212_010364 [Trichoderma ghanense]|uniref:Uncharacterized protein n=1 Tax=Trichoderma ghanense TaxID=65468 RepID=A0ABY2GQ37_9HYPO